MLCLPWRGTGRLRSGTTYLSWQPEACPFSRRNQESEERARRTAEAGEAAAPSPGRCLTKGNGTYISILTLPRFPTASKMSWEPGEGCQARGGPARQRQEVSKSDPPSQATGISRGENSYESPSGNRDGAPPPQPVFSSLGLHATPLTASGPLTALSPPSRMDALPSPPLYLFTPRSSFIPGVDRQSLLQRYQDTRDLFLSPQCCVPSSRAHTQVAGCILCV